MEKFTAFWWAVKGATNEWFWVLWRKGGKEECWRNKGNGEEFLQFQPQQKAMTGVQLFVASSPWFRLQKTRSWAPWWAVESLYSFVEGDLIALNLFLQMNHLNWYSKSLSGNQLEGVIGFSCICIPLASLMDWLKGFVWWRPEVCLWHSTSIMYMCVHICIFACFAVKETIGCGKQNAELDWPFPAFLIFLLQNLVLFLLYWKWDEEHCLFFRQKGWWKELSCARL